MVYFNYFIKCIIRKFVNMIFKPKMFFALLIIIGLLFAMNIKARAAWTDDNIQRVIEDLESISSMSYHMYKELDQIKNNTGDIEDMLSAIDTKILTVNSHLGSIKETLNNMGSTTEIIRENTFMINSNLIKVINNLNSISTGITDIYNKLDANQKELLRELDKDNQAILEEINMIRDAINGSEEELTTYTDLGIIASGNTTSNYLLRAISINYESKYTYTVKVYCKNNLAFGKQFRVYSSDNLFVDGFNYLDFQDKATNLDMIPSGATNYVINYTVPSSKPKYIYFGWGVDIEKIEVYRSIKGITESLNDSNSLQQQQNQLQQQQNQLQQEQNDFLSKPTEDSDVSVDSFNNVDSNDITSSGLSGVFNTIYNSITSWNSKDIVLPIPKVNKIITIPANYTENIMSKIGGGVLVNIIHTVYYFIVSRFMIYSITNIINSIKSGSILETDSKNNITTDML